MGVKWGSLTDVLVASLGITILVVVMFSLGIVAWARSGADDGPRRGARAVPRGGRQKAAFVVAGLCFAACLAVAAYGIDVIVPG